MTHPADAYIRARDAACVSVGTLHECMGAPRASGRRDRTSERGEGRACTSGGRAWAWWMRACVRGDPAGTHTGRRGDPVGTHTGVRGDPAGTGVRGSSRHGRAGIQQARACGDPAGTDGRAWGSSRHGRAWGSTGHGRAMIQRARTRACEDPASMNDGVVIPRASKRSV